MHGRVQGVGFRWTTQQQARALGLSGWIRNRRCGQRVEIAVRGDEAPLQEFLAWCKHGPQAARVERVEPSDDDPPEPIGEGFGVLPTV